MTAITRRRSARDDETEEQEDRPARRGRRASDDMPDEERNSPPRRGRRHSDGDDKGAGVADEPRNRRGRSRDEDEDEGDERPARSRNRRGARGFGSFEQKRAKSSSRADEFKPGFDNKVLIKLLEGEPFDNYNQHWIEARDLPSGVKKQGYICTDDEFYEDEDWDGCPLCEIGEPSKSYSMFNILDLTNPRKPEVKVWTTPPGLTEKLKRAAKEKKTSPLDRDDLYWEVELVKSKNKSEWTLTPVKARDLVDDYDVDPLDEGELDTFKEKLFSSRTDVTKVDTYDDLDELAEALSD